MSLNRILNLIKYDWSLYKRNFGIALAIFAGIFLVGGGCTFLWNLIINHFDHADSSFLPISMLMFASNFYQYGAIVMVILVTVVLHHKFTNPRTSTAYLTLPGTSAEKLAVMCIDYIVGALSVQAIMYAGLLFFFFLGSIIAPEADWFTLFKINDEMELIDAIYAEMRPDTGNDPESFAAVMSMVDEGVPGFSVMFRDFFQNVMYFGIFSHIASTLFYVMLNLCFKKNAQLKAIACEIGIGVVCMIAMIVFVSIYIVTHKEGWSPVNAAGDVSPSNLTGPAALIQFIFGTITWFLRLSPVFCAALLGIVYKQISKKQPF